MKRAGWVLAVLAAVCCVCCMAFAEEVTYTCGNYKYVLREDGSAEVTEYTGQGGDIIIPNDLDGHPIMAMRSNVFTKNFGHRKTAYTVSVHQDHPYLATINGVLFGKSDRRLICYPYTLEQTEYVIPQGIGVIGDYAFRLCTGLTDVTIPDSVTNIGEWAFSYCTGLTAITIPDSVTNIGEGAFVVCTGLTAVTIPDSVTSIGDHAFAGCTSLTRFEISAAHPVYEQIDDVLFHKESSMLVCYPAGRNASEYAIPDSVTSVGDDAFFGCTGLTDVTIPDSVTSIGWSAFEGCTGLTAVTIPDSVTSIGWFAFSGCTGLTAVTIPDSVTSIGWCAFSGCTGLTAVTIPDSVTCIEPYAFYNCPNLTLRVLAGSYAETYCRENNLRYIPYDPTLEDAPTDWLGGN